MTKGRIEAFSDAVIAIVMTIMVLELKVPHDPNWSALRPLLPVFLSYVLSFVYLGIYWNNHHHLFQAVQSVKGPVLWANMHLLFWLSLIPFATAWMGENHFSATPTALYGIVLLACAMAYSILVHGLMRQHGRESVIHKAIGKDAKGNLSVICYCLAVGMAYIAAPVSWAIYIFVALIWLTPDKRIERTIPESGGR